MIYRLQTMFVQLAGLEGKVKSAYDNKLYWNGRYFDEINYHDWYCDYDDIQDTLEKVLNRLQRAFRNQILEIMDIGCGTSTMSQNIIKNFGDKVNILAIDQSKNCIKFMDYVWKNDNEDNISNLVYSVQIFENMGYKRTTQNYNKYHLIFDKATIDSILCGINGENKSRKLINENIYNQLKLNGTYLLISHNPNRYNLFIKSKWAINRTKIEILF